MSIHLKPFSVTSHLKSTKNVWKRTKKKFFQTWNHWKKFEINKKGWKRLKKSSSTSFWVFAAPKSGSKYLTKYTTRYVWMISYFKIGTHFSYFISELPLLSGRERIAWYDVKMTAAFLQHAKHVNFTLTWGKIIFHRLICHMKFEGRAEIHKRIEF